MHLHRIDPDRNMARFYSMSVQPNLFGEWTLLREWGRIGKAGRLVSGRFASEREAAGGMRSMSKPSSAEATRLFERSARPHWVSDQKVINVLCAGRTHPCATLNGWQTEGGCVTLCAGFGANAHHSIA